MRGYCVFVLCGGDRRQPRPGLGSPPRHLNSHGDNEMTNVTEMKPPSLAELEKEVILTRFVRAVGGVDCLVELSKDSEKFWARHWSETNPILLDWLTRFISLSLDHDIRLIWTNVTEACQAEICRKTEVAAKRAIDRIIASTKKIEGAA